MTTQPPRQNQPLDGTYMPVLQCPLYFPDGSLPNQIGRKLWKNGQRPNVMGDIIKSYRTPNMNSVPAFQSTYGTGRKKRIWPADAKKLKKGQMLA